MKMRNIPQCKLLIQAKQSKSSQGTKQLKAPEIVKQTLVYNLKQSKKETEVNSQSEANECARHKAQGM
jgi:hypothetical protein